MTATDPLPSERQPNSPRSPNSEVVPLATVLPDASSPSATYTVDEAITHVGIGPFQFSLLTIAGLCWTAESMEMLLLSFIKAPLQCAWRISDASAALITTFVGLGMLVGATVWGLLADRYGRRIAFILSTFCTFFFGLVSALSINYHMLLFARAAAGFGIGGVPISFSLIMEFLPAQHRGTYGMGIAFFWSLGALFETIVAMLVLPRLGWRWLIGISSVPLAFVLLLSFFVCESPHWLIARGHVHDAQQVLNKISITNSAPLPQGELCRMETESRTGRIFDLVQPGARSLAIKVWLLWFSVAFLYYGLVMLQPEMLRNHNSGKLCDYLQRDCANLSDAGKCRTNPSCSWTEKTTVCQPALLTRAGSTTGTQMSPACRSQLTQRDFVSAVWASVGELPGIVVALTMVDCIGRRPLLGYMFGFTAVSFLLLLGCLGEMAETVTFFVARGTSSGVFQAVYLFTSELYPAEMRATATGISSSMARIGLIITPFLAQFLENRNHAAAVSLYFAISAAAVLVVWSIPVETARRPLLSSMDELVQLLQSRAPVATDIPTFAKDPSAPPSVRFFRWSAKVDGEAT